MKRYIIKLEGNVYLQGFDSRTGLMLPCLSKYDATQYDIQTARGIVTRYRDNTGRNITIHIAPEPGLLTND